MEKFSGEIASQLLDALETDSEDEAEEDETTQKEDAVAQPDGRTTQQDIASQSSQDSQDSQDSQESLVREGAAVASQLSQPLDMKKSQFEQ